MSAALRAPAGRLPSARRAAALVAACGLGLAVASGLGAGEPGEAPSPSEAAWDRWGGPDQDFRAPAASLASSWPEDGPPVLWRRPLGAGYSAILYEAGRLYTMYRSPADEEVVVCLAAGSGETVWEHRYEEDYVGGLRGYGIGPRSTPLLAGERLFTVGVAGRMNAYRKIDGQLLWSRELWEDEDLAGNRLGHGYSSSPIAHGDLVIVPVGGDKAGLAAFDQGTGRPVWRSTPLRNSYSSPRLVELAGERQVVAFMADSLIGVDPDDGRLLWSYPHENQWGHNISLPLVVDGDSLFLSSPQAGAKGLRVERRDGAFEVEELWSNRRIQLYHVSSVREGDWVYGSTGVTSPAFLVAVNAKTGDIGWRRRGFAKANCLWADGKLLILDEDGRLALARATPEDLTVLADTRLFDRVAWTVPTVVERTLYVRDRREILALDLGRADRER